MTAGPEEVGVAERDVWQLCGSDPPTQTVYSMFDTDGRCLYVGLTESPADRLPAHRGKAWWSFVRRIEMLDVDLAGQGLGVEAALIALERPLHNDSRGALSKVRCMYDACADPPGVLVGVNHRVWLACHRDASVLPEVLQWEPYRRDHKLTTWRCLPVWWLRALPTPIPKST